MILFLKTEGVTSYFCHHLTEKSLLKVALCDSLTYNVNPRVKR
jgi:hypothetical protein